MSGTALEFAEETPGSGCSAGIARGIVEVLTEGRANDNRPRKRLTRCDYSTEAQVGIGQEFGRGEASTKH